ncbi:PAS domain-containing protein, partial [Thiolapillus sp.]|uniref:PAS domain-containing protein n=3 Tax=Thiolapillus sp. TaxID=2017437 RepID=UPI0025DFE72E
GWITMALCFLQVLREPVVQYLAGSEQRIAPFWNIITWYPTRQWYPLILSVQRNSQRKARLYRKLVDEANSIFLRWDVDGNIISINRYGEELFGYPKQHLVGKPVLGTIVEEVDSEGYDLAAMIEDIRRNPDAHANNENENITRDGRRVWIGWRNAYIDAGHDDKPELLSIGVDMTERKRVENALYAWPHPSAMPRPRRMCSATPCDIWHRPMHPNTPFMPCMRMTAGRPCGYGHCGMGKS